MGILDKFNELTDRFLYKDNDEYYEDDYYDSNDENVGTRTTGSGTARTNPYDRESVAVYTRSGRKLTSEESLGDASYGTYTTSSTPPYKADTGTSAPYVRGSYGTRASDTYGSSSAGSGGAYESSATARQLPAYVLKASSYDDCESLTRRARTGQPVILVLTDCELAPARRILDFGYGLALGLGGEMREIGNKVFALIPRGVELNPSDLKKLSDDGLIANIN